MTSSDVMLAYTKEYDRLLADFTAALLEIFAERKRTEGGGDDDDDALGGLGVSLSFDVDVHLCRDNEKRSPISIVEFRNTVLKMRLSNIICKLSTSISLTLKNLNYLRSHVRQGSCFCSKPRPASFQQRHCCWLLQTLNKLDERDAKFPILDFHYS